MRAHHEHMALHRDTRLVDRGRAGAEGDDAVLRLRMQRVCGRSGALIPKGDRLPLSNRYERNRILSVAHTRDIISLRYVDKQMIHTRREGIAHTMAAARAAQSEQCVPLCSTKCQLTRVP
jgi:hypothetical protein